MEKLSFVIPCYNSEKTIEKVIVQITDVIKEIKHNEYEIILVNDGSPDNVGAVIEKICLKDKNIKGINLSRNFGQHSAMMAGYKYVTGDIIIDVDDDGEIPVSELPKLLNEIYNGYDLVVAKKKESKRSLFRNLGTSLNNHMANALINKPNDIIFTSFVVMRRFIMDEIVRYENAYPYLLGLMLQSTNNIKNVEVDFKTRIEGSSEYTFKKLLSLWLNGFTAFSVKPLRVSTYIGFICAFGGFLFGVYTIVSRLLNPELLPGYSSLMATILFIGGMIMIMLGLIGEYIGRIYISINNAPQFVIRDKYNIEND